MNSEPCTPEMLREEADVMFGGSLDKLAQMLREKLALPGGLMPGMARYHFEDDLVTLERMINGDPV